MFIFCVFVNEFALKKNYSKETHLVRENWKQLDGVAVHRVSDCQCYRLDWWMDVGESKKHYDSKKKLKDRR